MLKAHHSLPLMFLLSTHQLLMTSCGSARFDSGTNARDDDAYYQGQDVDQLTWFWQCKSSPAPAPAGYKSNVVIQGAGDHKFLSSSFSKTPLILSGKVCPPSTYPRDIVFVIDVSGSMAGWSGNDPKVNNSCGRLRAVQSIIDGIADAGGDAQFAIVTFSSGVMAKSSSMYATSSSLFGDVGKGGSIANTLCAASGETNYGSGLSAAEDILSGSRSGAIKEIYFVSDGEPTDSNGPVVADRLKKTGILDETGKRVPVSIATVMLGSADDSKLRELTSKPEMHAGAVAAGDLAEVLGELAKNDIVEGSIKYRPIGSDYWEEISLMDKLQAYSFSIPAATIDSDSAPKGLEVSFEYRDQHDNLYSEEGKILWSDTSVKN
jgi:hypothetical protein